MTTQSTLAIEAAGLVKRFGDTRAVDGVDLAVRRGSVYGVLGPNGAGKTTTIRMLATLLRPDAGTARVLGHDIVARGRRGARARQPHRPARLGRRGPHRPREPDPARPAARPAARRAPGRGPTSCSRRSASPTRPAGWSSTTRAACAAGSTSPPASSSRRELMFLDEPTTGLDPRSRNQVWDIVRALVAEGTTILLCTQYLDEADQLADGIAVIDHGKVIAEGTPGQLKASVGSGRAARAPARPRAAARGRARARARARRGRTSRPTRRRCRRRAPTPTAPPRRSPSWRAPASASPTSRSASRAWTRSSWRSPATRPRSQARRDATRSAQHEHRPRRPSRAGADDEAALRKALASTPRPPRASALSAALTFGWRGMLKIKHVPEQLLDVTITPVMFLLMFTYLFGGAIAGSTGEYLRLHPARASS